ncbi:unnamed protein product (macronuclear) [Paramecium tetraurelia]|uniref:Protein kinase domain-containing protein n=1 Tax=Paramecium tetraurelia TaxID=5888 RepID=A0C1G0_PARTE|nr:uncharacterized protein GSPATT00034103001 [Paramecium tetraurelia]CAK64627.1 unnamed protein product [Paramecium tetraurelia]|eukprot:XP_001432024.1 hypothetical protein (macronuclear) [Paramecium tetraurelia strain d4-2]
MNFYIKVTFNNTSCHLTIDNENNLVIMNQIQMMTFPLNLDANIVWRLENNLLKGFEINAFLFLGDHHDLLKLKSILGQLVTYKKISNMYNFLSTLGKGNYSQVCLLQCKITHKLYAAKCMKKENPAVINDIKREIQIWSMLQHKNVAKFYEVYESTNKIYVVMEKLNKLRNDYDHEEIKLIMKAILEGVNYIHSKNIIHRDLKIDNILIDDENQVKIIDFGLACQFINVESRNISCGTPGYIAPEVLINKSFDYKSDIFSIGVVMYQLYFNKHLFQAEQVADILKLNKKFTISRLSVLDIPDCGYQFLISLLNHNPTQRITASQALSHWYMNSIKEEHFTKVPRNPNPKFKDHLQTCIIMCSKTTITSYNKIQ